MGRRFARIVVMRTLAAMRWLGIHALTPAVSTGKLTFNTLQFGHRLRVYPTERDEPGRPTTTEAKNISSFRTLGRIMAKAWGGTDC